MLDWLLPWCKVLGRVSIGLGIDHHKIKHNKLTFAENLSWPQKADFFKMEKGSFTNFWRFFFVFQKKKGCSRPNSAWGQQIRKRLHVMPV